MLVIRWANIIDFAGAFIGKKKTRAHSRVESRNLVRFTTPGQFPELITNLVNFSEGGLQFSVKSRIKPGTLLKMVINLVERDMDVPVVAKVCWVKAIMGKGEAYRVGVSFQEILPEHQSILRSLAAEKQTFGR